MDNMTALVSAFARAYHYQNSHVHVFADDLAQRLLSDKEYSAISKNMTDGIAYFAPGFEGTPDEALRYVVDHQLAPSVLARSAFCERAIDNAARIGCRQVALYAVGYDIFPLRNRDSRLAVFELDRPAMIADRWARIHRAGLEPACRVEAIGCDLSGPEWKDRLIRAGFDPGEASFASLLGISYYLSKGDFKRLIEGIASICPEGSSVCLDYPMAEGGAEARRNRELAAAAGEAMKAKYAYDEMEALLADAGFLIYEHMDANEATDAFFAAYNREEPAHAMRAPEGVGYCLAVKKGN